MDTEHPEELLSNELEAARKHIEDGLIRLRVARAVSSEFNLDLPAWAYLKSLSDLSEMNKRGSSSETKSQNNAIDDNEPIDKDEVQAENSAPTMPQMVLNYFSAVQTVAEPNEVDTWAKKEYPEADIKDYAIGQTMSRMSRDGRLHSKKYPDRRSSVYGLPEWASSNERENSGFEFQYLPKKLQSLAESEELSFQSVEGSRQSNG